jgi:prevent-host-death family protein
MQVNIHEAKTSFSKLIIRASKGEEIIIARAGKPVAKLVALEKKKRFASQAVLKDSSP